MVTHLLVCDNCKEMVEVHPKSAAAVREEARKAGTAMHVGRKDYCRRCAEKLFPCGPYKKDEPR